MKAIAAMASNRVIGKDGKLPWHIKGDLRFFKKMTEGSVCVVGSKTFDSLPYLAGRSFIIHTRNEDYLFYVGLKNRIAGIWWDEGNYPLDYNKDYYLIGGAETYKKGLPLCTDLYLTRIFKSYDGDTFFPSFEHLFVQKEVVETTDEYAIVHYTRRRDDEYCHTT